MSLLDDILGQASESATVQNLAAKVGMTPDEVGTAIVALTQAHGQGGEAVQRASAVTGISADKLNEIIHQIGGEGALGRFASVVEDERGLSAAVGGITKLI